MAVQKEHASTASSDRVASVIPIVKRPYQEYAHFEVARAWISCPEVNKCIHKHYFLFIFEDLKDQLIRPCLLDFCPIRFAVWDVGKSKDIQLAAVATDCHLLTLSGSVKTNSAAELNTTGLPVI